MSYCSTAELVNLTGSTASATILQEVIDEADRQIDARLALAGLTGSGGAIKSASMHLSIAGLLTRMRMDGEKPGSLSIPGLSMSDNIDAAIAEHRSSADQMLAVFIAYQTRGNQIYLYKVNGP